MLLKQTIKLHKRWNLMKAKPLHKNYLACRRALSAQFSYNLQPEHMRQSFPWNFPFFFYFSFNFRWTFKKEMNGGYVWPLQIGLYSHFRGSFFKSSSDLFLRLLFQQEHYNKKNSALIEIAHKCWKYPLKDSNPLR